MQQVDKTGVAMAESWALYFFLDLNHTAWGQQPKPVTACHVLALLVSTWLFSYRSRDRYQDKTPFIIMICQRRREGGMVVKQLIHELKRGLIKSWQRSLYWDTEKPYEQYHYHMCHEYQYHISHQWQYISNEWSSNIFSIIICYQLTNIWPTTIMYEDYNK